MHHVYGLRPEQHNFQERAAALRSGVLGEYVADIDANARFPKESVAALARDGFFGLCVSKEFAHNLTSLRDLPTLRARLADMNVRTDGLMNGGVE